MATLRDLRQRKQSVLTSKKMTSAMKMVAAAKMRQFQKRFELASSHLESIEQALAVTANTMDPASWPSVTRPRKASPSDVLWIVVGADRGFCGSFNTQILRAFDAAQDDETQAMVMTIGDKMGPLFEKTDLQVVSKQSMENKPAFSKAQDILAVATTLFQAGQVQEVVILSTRFKNVMRQDVVAQTLFPFPLETIAAPLKHQRQPLVYCEPTPTLLCESLTRFAMEATVMKALLESCLSEQGSRMTAMDSATRNSEDILAKLDLTYNRKRQSLITNELIEVISGANL
jgi:F-type H+-transporting ATPase subunit gamma